MTTEISRINREQIRLRQLIYLPVITYIISYFYLTYYHKHLFLFNTVVHESGQYTLLQNIFYASHFLGHVPVHTMLAFYFVGVYQCLAPSYLRPFSKRIRKWLILSVIFLLFMSFIAGLVAFGSEDTLSYIRQAKQGVGIYQQGGSWNLHLPSSLLLILLIPVYIFFIRLIYKRPIKLNNSGVSLLSIGLVILLLLTVLVNLDSFNTVVSILKNPRYLAHSVRELMTFTITYFPLPLYFMLRVEENRNGSIAGSTEKKLYLIMIILTALFLMGLFYQSYISLAAGIGRLAQKPFFAKNGELGIPYLLASHYFEHFLDTVYFTLLCLILYTYSGKNGRKTFSIKVL